MLYDDIDMNCLDNKDSFGVFRIREQQQQQQQQQLPPPPLPKLFAAPADDNSNVKKDTFKSPFKRDNTNSASEVKHTFKFGGKRKADNENIGGGNGGVGGGGGGGGGGDGGGGNEPEKKFVPADSAPSMDFRHRTAVSFQEKLSTLEERDKYLREHVHKSSSKNMSVIVMGTCPDMCPEKERLLREITCSFSIFEGQVVDNEMHVVPELLVKEYSRSSADQDEPLPHELRPEPVLMDTMSHILVNIVPKIDNQSLDLMEWYHFCWDRLRSLRKDIIQQQLCSVNIVRILERSARFHICCIDRLFGTETKVFDEKINAENLVNCLQMLITMYESLEKRGVRCENETEFRIYMMLLLLDSGDVPDVLRWDADTRSRRACAEVREIFFAFKQNLYTRFFRLVKKTSYLNACILQRYFGVLKTQILNVLVNSYATGSKLVRFPMGFVKKVLELDSDEEAIALVESHGFRVSDGEVRGSKSTFTVPEVKARCSTSHILRRKRVPILEAVTKLAGYRNESKLSGVHMSFDRRDVLKADALNAEDQKRKVIAMYGDIYQRAETALALLDEEEEADGEDAREEKPEVAESMVEKKKSPVRKLPETTFTFRLPSYKRVDPVPSEPAAGFANLRATPTIDSAPLRTFSFGSLPKPTAAVTAAAAAAAATTFPPPLEPVPPVQFAPPKVPTPTMVSKPFVASSAPPAREERSPGSAAMEPMDRCSAAAAAELYDPEAVSDAETETSTVGGGGGPSDEPDIPTYSRRTDEIVDSLTDALKQFENLYTRYFEASNAMKEQRKYVAIRKENRKLRRTVRKKLKQNNARKYLRLWRKKIETIRKKRENFIGIVHLPVDEYFKLWGTVKSRNMIPKNIVAEVMDKESTVKWSSGLLEGKPLSVNYIGDRLAESLAHNVRTRCGRLRLKIKNIVCWKVILSLPGSGVESYSAFVAKMSELCKLLFYKEAKDDLGSVQEERTADIKVFTCVRVETGPVCPESKACGATSLVVYTCGAVETKEALKERLLSLVCTDVTRYPVYVQVVSNDSHEKELITCLTLLKKRKRILGWSVTKWQNFFTVPKAILKGVQQIPWTPYFETRSMTELVKGAGEEFFTNVCFLLRQGSGAFANTPVTFVKLYNEFLGRVKEALYAEEQRKYGLSEEFLERVNGSSSRNTFSEPELVELVDKYRLIGFTRWPPKSVDKLIAVLNKYCDALESDGGTLLANILRLLDTGLDDVKVICEQAPWLKIVELWFKYTVQAVVESEAAKEVYVFYDELRMAEVTDALWIFNCGLDDE